MNGLQFLGVVLMVVLTVVWYVGAKSGRWS